LFSARIPSRSNVRTGRPGCTFGNTQSLDHPLPTAGGSGRAIPRPTTTTPTPCRCSRPRLRRRTFLSAGLPLAARNADHGGPHGRSRPAPGCAARLRHPRHSDRGHLRPAGPPRRAPVRCAPGRDRLRGCGPRVVQGEHGHGRRRAAEAGRHPHALHARAGRTARAGRRCPHPCHAALPPPGAGAAPHPHVRLHADPQRRWAGAGSRGGHGHGGPYAGCRSAGGARSHRRADDGAAGAAAAAARLGAARAGARAVRGALPPRGARHGRRDLGLEPHRRFDVVERGHGNPVRRAAAHAAARQHLLDAAPASGRQRPCARGHPCDHRGNVPALDRRIPVPPPGRHLCLGARPRLRDPRRRGHGRAHGGRHDRHQRPEAECPAGAAGCERPCRAGARAAAHERARAAAGRSAAIGGAHRHGPRGRPRRHGGAARGRTPARARQHRPPLRTPGRIAPRARLPALGAAGRGADRAAQRRRAAAGAAGHRRGPARHAVVHRGAAACRREHAGHAESKRRSGVHLHAAPCGLRADPGRIAGRRAAAAQVRRAAERFGAAIPLALRCPSAADVGLRTRQPAHPRREPRHGAPLRLHGSRAAGHDDRAALAPAGARAAGSGSARPAARGAARWRAPPPLPQGRHADRHGGLRGRHHFRRTVRAAGARHRRDAAHARGARAGARRHGAAAAERLQRGAGARHQRIGPALGGVPHRARSRRLPQCLGGHGAQLDRRGHGAPQHRAVGLVRPDHRGRGGPAPPWPAGRPLDAAQPRPLRRSIAHRPPGHRARPGQGPGRRSLGATAHGAGPARRHQPAAARCGTGVRAAHALPRGRAGDWRRGNRTAAAACQRHRLRAGQPAHAPGPAAPAGGGAQGGGRGVGQHRHAVLQAARQPYVRRAGCAGGLRDAPAAAAGWPAAARGDAVARGRGRGAAQCRVRAGRHAEPAPRERGRVRDTARHLGALPRFARRAHGRAGLRRPAAARRRGTRASCSWCSASRCSSRAW